ncbi:major facilitator superfamily domain-containing protein [Xylariaceae sp. FL0804]|nr:major facilitator superfamily domain-containing protein [Xylariaceae sp. FL0804]
MIDTFGVINSFGVFQTYYETQLLRGRSSSDISWIGSLQGSLLTLLGIISGPLYDAGYIFTLTATGTFLIVFGMFMTSLCTEYWQVVLAQGLCVGGGAGLAFTPSAAVLSQYFARRRSIALGIQSVGSPLAGICFPILFSRLEPRIGFGWTTRVLAFILLGLAPIPLIFMRPRIPPPKQKRAFLDKSAFTDVPFVVWMIGGFFTFLGLYVPSFYVQLFSEEHGLASSQFSAYLVTLLNAGSVLGRLVPSFAVRYLTTFPGGSSSGRSNAMLALTAAGAGVLAYAWVAVGIRGSLGGVIAFAVLFGFCNGGVTSLPQSAVVAFVPDLARLGTRLGMAFFVVGLSVLFGSPIAGAILKDPTNEADWRGLQIYTGTTMLLGSALYALSQLLLVRRQREGVAAAAAAAAA